MSGASRGAPGCTQALLASIVVVLVSSWSAQHVIISMQNPWLRTTPDSSSRASISAKELVQLSSRDVVLIIDKSRSMAVSDCLAAPEDTIALGIGSPNAKAEPRSAVSRWQWCRQQTSHLVRETEEVLPAGIRVVLFSGRSVVYNNVNARGIEAIFSDNQPAGRTDATSALKTQLDLYFEGRSRLGRNAKPLLIAMITDGCLIRPTSVGNAILDATKRMTRPDEVSLALLQVGYNRRGTKLLQDVDRCSLDERAPFDIVHVTPFAKLSRIGLRRALLDALAKKQILDSVMPLANPS